MTMIIDEEDPRTADVVDLLRAHLDFAHAHSPDEHVHALDLTGLTIPEVTFCTARDGGILLGVGAIKELGGGRAEIKSMHTTAPARGRGVGRAMVEHLVALARERGLAWIGLETGTGDAFAPARGLYASLGFSPCEPFGAYTVNEWSTCMELELDASAPAPGPASGI